MSVISPRSHALAHNEHYQDQAELYMWCNIVKPGIARWAWVNGLMVKPTLLIRWLSEKTMTCNIWKVGF
jgi:lipopolysaccharide/colanic/teichoic acid biosynthesis glycosyltransferase